MLSAICLLFNVLIVVYFGVTKRRALCALYALALGTIAIMIVFPFDTEEGVAFWASIFGDSVYDAAPWIADTYARTILTPYFGLELLSFLLALVFTLKTAEKVYYLCRSKSSARFQKTNKTPSFAARKPRFSRVQKKYLSFCSFLC